jgi:hypothetical protein
VNERPDGRVDLLVKRCENSRGDICLKVSAAMSILRYKFQQSEMNFLMKKNKKILAGHFYPLLSF